MDLVLFDRWCSGDGRALSTGCGSDDVSGGRWSGFRLADVPGVVNTWVGHFRRVERLDGSFPEGWGQGRGLGCPGLVRGDGGGTPEGIAAAGGVGMTRGACELRHRRYGIAVSQRQSEGIRGNHLVSLGVGTPRYLNPKGLVRPRFGSTVRSPARRTGHGRRDGCAVGLYSPENTVRQNAFSVVTWTDSPGVPGVATREGRAAAVADCAWPGASSTQSRVSQTGLRPDRWIRHRGRPVREASSREWHGHA